MTVIALVALDWGSSHLRAHALGPDGRVLDQRHGTDGASSLAGGAAAFEAALDRLAGDWCAGGVPVLACGMVGSAHGWVAAPYLDCPVELARLHRHLVQAPRAAGAPVRIVPGLCQRGAGQPADVMRGEETQLAGLLAAAPALAEAACVLMPGTHSKWVALRGGRVQGFTTRMTGELYALLRTQSVLARLMEARADPPLPEAQRHEAFDAGVAEARHGGGADLLQRLFGLRADGLLRGLGAEAAAERLSGLLIGAELAAGLAAEGGDAALALVGEPALCARYQRALGCFGRRAEVFEQPLAALGLWQVARAAGLA